jgi:hypothetical protein
MCARGSVYCFAPGDLDKLLYNQGVKATHQRDIGTDIVVLTR